MLLKRKTISKLRTDALIKKAIQLIWYSVVMVPRSFCDPRSAIYGGVKYISFFNKRDIG